VRELVAELESMHDNFDTTRQREKPNETIEAAKAWLETSNPYLAPKLTPIAADDPRAVALRATTELERLRSKIADVDTAWSDLLLFVQEQRLVKVSEPPDAFQRMHTVVLMLTLDGPEV
jgi:hypothetical protein